jgi:hypothetical protein
MVNRIFLKKMSRGPDLPRTGPIRRETGPDPPAACGAADLNGLPAGPASQRPREAETVPGPSDQVMIDGRCSSSTREGSGVAETLGFCLEIAGLTVASLNGGEGVSGGCEGSRWSRLVVGEAGTVPGDGVLEGVLQALRLGVAMATCSTGPSQNGEYG